MNTLLLPNDLQDCITACWDCRNHCQKMLYNHCLEKGGEHAAPDHVRIMTDCIQMCQTAADFMVRGSPLAASACAACAEVCYACADSCESINDDDMKNCAQLCRECAEMCDDISLAQTGDLSGAALQSSITLI